MRIAMRWRGFARADIAGQCSQEIVAAGPVTGYKAALSGNFFEIEKRDRLNGR